ncbi:transposase [bacterium]|nr:transposase [bacterium]
MRCIYCDNKKLYILKTGQLKCSRCKKKFSPKKILTDSKILHSFCNDLSASQTARDLNIHYISVQKRYEHFRQLIAKYLEDVYRENRVIEYDEYIYLEKSKKKIKENIFDAHNFLTFHYDDKVYNLLMPNLRMYKNQFMDDRAEEVYFKEFSKFMMLNKISKTQKNENLITKFWLFFEASVVKYKGIKSENFFYYLKEIEFKFNYQREKQIEILFELYKS